MIWFSFLARLYLIKIILRTHTYIFYIFFFTYFYFNIKIFLKTCFLLFYTSTKVFCAFRLLAFLSRCFSFLIWSLIFFNLASNASDAFLAESEIFAAFLYWHTQSPRQVQGVSYAEAWIELSGLYALFNLFRIRCLHKIV